MILILSTNTGIGDLILLRLYVDTIWPGYEKLILQINEQSLGFRDTSGAYKQFVEGLIKILFTVPLEIVYIGGKGSNFNKAINYGDINLSKELILYDPAYHIEEPYIVVSTKIGRMHYTHYTEIKERFLETLRNLSCKVVIIGERNKSTTPEANMLGGFYSCIYTDLITLPNVIDKTLVNDLMGTPILEDFRKDCYLISRAQSAVHLGIGGLFCTTCVLTKTVSYSIINSDRNDVYHTLASLQKKETILITSDKEEFFKIIASF